MTWKKMGEALLVTLLLFACVGERAPIVQNQEPRRTVEEVPLPTDATTLPLDPLDATETLADESPPTAASSWTVSGANPLISSTRPPKGLRGKLARTPVLIWNDPSVLKEGERYSMWLGAGNQPKGNAIYELSSPDGIDWSMDNQGEPVLTRGSRWSGDFDWFGVETPAVIKVGGTYHLYYSAYHDGRIPYVTMGHATSSDGPLWVHGTAV
jgi:hypothetical protein